jgi:hypothetical protein
VNVSLLLATAFPSPFGLQLTSVAGLVLRFNEQTFCYGAKRGLSRRTTHWRLRALSRFWDANTTRILFWATVNLKAYSSVFLDIFFMCALLATRTTDIALAFQYTSHVGNSVSSNAEIMFISQFNDKMNFWFWCWGRQFLSDIAVNRCWFEQSRW